MITKIHIKNFKSIYDLEFAVGRVNLFIGENGSGKSNILEALAFVSASESNKLDDEFLFPRGIRVTKSSLMRSAFSEEHKERDIKIIISYDNDKIEYSFYNDNLEYSKWHTSERILDVRSDIVKLYNETEELRDEAKIRNLLTNMDTPTFEKLKYFVANNEKIIDFLIYSPENTALRKFYEDGQIKPLGINGEGLLRLLKVVNNYKDKSYISIIIESLQLFGWFENIKIPINLSSSDDKIIIKDRYLDIEFDQRSTNEGFLFILFYITLMVAKETPKAFAIDNIDASLNPKLCTRLMMILVKLAKKYDKQIFLTTHNPAILDGIDLNDKNEKIFVASRNELGHTKLKQLTEDDNPMDEDGEYINLSEAFLHGYFGGLPKGF